MSAETDLAVIGPAASEAASLVMDALGLAGEPAPGFNLWTAEAGELGDLISGQAKAWKAPLVGGNGACGEIAIVLPAGADDASDAVVLTALRAGAAALAAACGADHIGEVQKPKAIVLTEPQPGQRALAVPLVSDGQRAGLLVVISPASEVAAELPHLDPSAGVGGNPRSIAALGDVQMTVSVELGRTKILIRDLLGIHNGAVVQLDRPVSHPVDIFVHGTLIARGEVVVVDECFAVRVTELLTGD